jgi:hypothetical protein
LELLGVDVDENAISVLADEVWLRLLGEDGSRLVSLLDQPLAWQGFAVESLVLQTTMEWVRHHGCPMDPLRARWAPRESTAATHA